MRRDTEPVQYGWPHKGYTHHPANVLGTKNVADKDCLGYQLIGAYHTMYGWIPVRPYATCYFPKEDDR